MHAAAQGGGALGGQSDRRGGITSHTPRDALYTSCRRCCCCCRRLEAQLGAAPVPALGVVPVRAQSNGKERRRGGPSSQSLRHPQISNDVQRGAPSRLARSLRWRCKRHRTFNQCQATELQQCTPGTRTHTHTRISLPHNPSCSTQPPSPPARRPARRPAGLPAYLILLSVRNRIQCGIGRFCLAFLAKCFLILKVLCEGCEWWGSGGQFGSGASTTKTGARGAVSRAPRETIDSDAWAPPSNVRPAEPGGEVQAPLSRFAWWQPMQGRAATARLWGPRQQGATRPRQWPHRRASGAWAAERSVEQRPSWPSSQHSLFLWARSPPPPLPRRWLTPLTILPLLQHSGSRKDGRKRAISGFGEPSLLESRRGGAE